MIISLNPFFVCAPRGAKPTKLHRIINRTVTSQINFRDKICIEICPKICYTEVREEEKTMLDFALEIIEDEKQRNELAEFYSKYKERFCTIAFSKLKNHEEAEDAVQVVFSEIADKPENFFNIAPQDRLKYTDVMVRNIAVEMFKSNNKVEFEELNEEIEDTFVSLEDAHFNGISYDEIISFMERLPTSQKSVIELRIYFGLSIDEISKRLNISLSAANKRLTLARKAIRDFIDERNVNYE